MPCRPWTALCACAIVLALAPGARGAEAYTITGARGLMTVPDARFEPIGTLRVSVAQANPYWHGTIGAQVAGPLWVGLRQTAWAEHPGAQPAGFYPGMDVKIRLLEEEGRQPALALGLQGAVGHRRMAGEYIVASKRFGPFDATLGLGWGRFSGAALMGNPLRLLGGHFDGPRSAGQDGADGARAADWFTGEDVGLLAGVAWRTPVPGLVLKADTSGEDWAVEAASGATDPTYKDRARWAVGADWTPERVPWLNIGVGTLGGEVFTGRVTLATNPGTWPVAPYRAKPFLGKKEILPLRDLGREGAEARLALYLNPFRPAPLQIGRAARREVIGAPDGIQGVAVTPYVMAFRGPTVHMPRSTLERAGKGLVSPEELWHATTIVPARAPKEKGTPGGSIPKGKQGTRHLLSMIGLGGPESELPAHIRHWGVVLEGQASLTEFDHGAPYRTSVLLTYRRHRPGYASSGGAALRVNLSDNLTSALSGRPTYTNPARADVAAFADNLVVLEDAYASWTHTFRPGVYGAVTTGYLEEMYMGTGGEVLWRPYASRFALGAEAWWLAKRDPYTDLALGVDGGNSAIATGHATLHYDLPEGWWGPDVALSLSAGRYLAGDVGATLAVRKGFANGATLRAFGTITNEQDRGPYGEKLGAYAGLSLEVPLGSLPHAPEASALRLTGAPLGRNAGQSLKKPLDLYEATRPLSLPRLAESWGSVAE